MKLFSLLTSKAPSMVFISILFGAMAGVAYSLVIPIVITSLSGNNSGLEFVNGEIETFLTFEVSNYNIAKLFFINCLVILLARTFSQVSLMRISMDVTTDLRVQLYNRIVSAPIEKLEAIGSSRLIAVITTDVGRIVSGSRVLPDLLMNIATLLGMLVFLLILNRDVFQLVIVAIIFGTVTYLIPMFIGNRYFRRSRESVDMLQESIRGLIFGAKELKLSKEKRRNYFKEVLLHHELDLLRADKAGHSIISGATNYGDLVCFFVIGAVAFIFVNYHSISEQELIGTIMALLYVTTPIAIIISFVPNVMMAIISLSKVNHLFDELLVETAFQKLTPIPFWNIIRFEKVSFKYVSNSQNGGFEIGPLNFEIEKGKITFIVGGNGSGKSTLSKLLTLHYSAKSGQIFYGETKVDDETINSCREFINSIYSDYYLFDRLLVGDIAGKEKAISELLFKLELSNKVKICNGIFSSTSLSDGQRRRLALLVSFIEDKELYVFDEWAADQDPTFKKIFYYDILPELKSKGKAVVVISHDERYFSVADKIIVMEDGRIKDS